MGEGVLIYGLRSDRMSRAGVKIAGVLADIRRKGYSTAKPFSIGRVEKRMMEYASKNGIRLGSVDVYMSNKSIAHAMRDTKRRKGLAISESALISFPKSRRKMELFYDGDSFIYTDRKTKYVIHPNYELKMKNGKVRKVAFITAGIVSDPVEFNQKRYKKI